MITLSILVLNRDDIKGSQNQSSGHKGHKANILQIEICMEIHSNRRVLAKFSNKIQL